MTIPNPMCLGFFCFFIYLFAFLHSWHLLFINFFLGIIALNAAVLCCWRIPSMQRSMLKYFTSNPASSEFTCATWSWPLLCLQCVHFFPLSSSSSRNTLPSHGSVLLQSLLHHPHGGQHVCPMDILLRDRLSFGERAISCSLPVCWWVK